MHGRGEIEEKGKRVWEIETKSVLKATSEENNSIISYHIISLRTSYHIIPFFYFLSYHIILLTKRKIGSYIYHTNFVPVYQSSLFLHNI